MTATTAPTGPDQPRPPPTAREETGGLGLVDLGRIAGRGLASRRVRSGLTALGIAIGIAAMLAVLGIAESSRATLLAQLDRHRLEPARRDPGSELLRRRHQPAR